MRGSVKTPSRGGEGYHRYKSEQFRTLTAKRRPSVQRSKGSTISVISAHPLRSLDPLRFEHSPSLLAFWGAKMLSSMLSTLAPRPRPISVPRFIRSRHRLSGVRLPISRCAVAPCPIPAHPSSRPPPAAPSPPFKILFPLSLSASSRYRSEIGEGDITCGRTHGGHGHGAARACVLLRSNG